jgi:hypothetical protein
LNVITGAIVVLMIFALSKKRHRFDLGHLYEIMEFIKKSDKRIKSIDAQLKSEFKKFNEF